VTDLDTLLAAEVDRLMPGWSVDLDGGHVQFGPQECPRCGTLVVLIDLPRPRLVWWREITADGLAARRCGSARRGGAEPAATPPSPPWSTSTPRTGHPVLTPLADPGHAPQPALDTHRASGRRGPPSRLAELAAWADRRRQDVHRAPPQRWPSEAMLVPVATAAAAPQPVCCPAAGTDGSTSPTGWSCSPGRPG
jgi:hypothetical protein